MPQPELVLMSAGEFATLLGQPRADGALLGTGTIAVRRSFVEEWPNQLGPRELTIHEVCEFTGWKYDTVLGWRKKGLIHCRARVGGRGPFGIAPEEMFRRLREIQQERNCHPTAAESAPQRASRGRRAKDRARAAIRGAR